ncbi:8735_t:CDS:2 [Gigaspora margarita]|uniref:peptide chain release factor N(5)-glutamine methyltransferase n=1 Tax=Gigaspora margarita TaxID=4874 RepID=A0ABN7VJW9_GIGMA|nr:8735_t:CDS:2 [Gigaspora margarita]
MVINVEEVKNDIIALCQTVPEKFWLSFFAKSLSTSNFSQICSNLNKYLKESYPVPYLTNKVAFYGLSFYIEKGVFIPQKDTEILVEKTLELADKIWGSKEQLRVLDIGTGCGNIAISLAKSRPNWNFTTSDINSQALKIAQINATNQQMKNIQFSRSNLFDNLDSKEKFDIIVSNPPYISAEEYKNLSPITKEQPPEALVAENDGYFFYQEILCQARNFLAKKFLLVVEIGYQQRENVIKLIIEYFPQAEVSIFSDYAEGRQFDPALNHQVIKYNKNKKYMVTTKKVKVSSTVSIVGKSKLAERVYSFKGKKLSLTKSQIEAVISEALEEIKKALIRKEEIRFPNYFSLKTFMAKPRTAMNLRTKKKMMIPAKRRTRFAISKDLKERIADGK